MHIKFLKHGRGDARKAAAYVLAERDHLGHVRAGVEVLRGDPRHVAEVANSLDFVHRYRSAVIAWAPDDKPTPEQVQEALNAFEALAFAGLEPDSYCWTAVQHIEQSGAMHVHVLVARVELGTGKSFNPAPPGWQKDYDPLRDAQNYEHRWARPDDPARARLVQPGHQALIDASALRVELNGTNTKEQITGWLVQRIEAGHVNDRAGVAASLSELGEITRQGKDYISVKPAGFDKAIRLKGAIYDQDFTREEFVRASERKAGTGSTTDRAADQRALDAARRDLEAAIRRRTEYNRRRYLAATASPKQDPDDRPQGNSTAEPDADDRDSTTDQAPFDVDEVAIAGSADRLPDSLLIDLGLVSDQHPVDGSANPEWSEISSTQGQVDNLPDRQGSSPVSADQLTTKEKHDERDGKQANSSGSHGRGSLIPLGRAVAGGQSNRGVAGLSPFALAATRGKHIRAFEPWRNRPADRARLRAAGHTSPKRLPVLRQHGFSARQRQPRHSLLHSAIQGSRSLYHALHRLYSIYSAMRHNHGNDRARELAVAGSIQSLQRVNSALDNHGNASEHLAEASRRIEHQNHRLAETTEQLKLRQQNEISRFKLEINLAEYAQSLGYEIDARESSRASTVMRRGDDKIIIATDQDGHGVYFSVRDDKDNGSIIDFVQRRQGKNIGQVRKELRPWIGNASSSYRPLRRPEAERPRKPEASTADRQRVLAAWMRMQPAGKHPYLMRDRKLSATTLGDPRFAGLIRIDARGNAVFPHFDRNGLAGYELKNKGFTGFARGGEKAFWHSSNIDHAPRVVVVESAIDAMSHAQLKRDREAAYISTGGSMSDKQHQLLREQLAAAKERGAEIILATDNDEGGNKLAAEISRLIPDAHMTRELPQGEKDWNDMLKKQAEHEKSRWNGPSYHM